MALPPFYTRAATTYEREVWKLEKEKSEKFDEAETILGTRPSLRVYHKEPSQQ